MQPAPSASSPPAPLWGLSMRAAVPHAAASCVLGPAIAAISLGLVGHFAVSERLGRNARFASIGSGVAAAGMGAAGYLISNRAVFLVTVALCVPTLFALSRICDGEIDAERVHGGKPVPHPGEPTATFWEFALPCRRWCKCPSPLANSVAS